jgi:hypothetical protein
VAKIKALLLESVGNPESGAIADFADTMAEAISKELDDCCSTEAKSFTPVSETRVIKPTEAR